MSRIKKILESTTESSHPIQQKIADILKEKGLPALEIVTAPDYRGFRFCVKTTDAKIRSAVTDTLRVYGKRLGVAGITGNSEGIVGRVV